MKLDKAIKILERHQKWRRGDEELALVSPKKLGIAIDTILIEVKKKNNVRRSHKKN